MNCLTIGNARIVNKYLGFLASDYHMNFRASEIPNKTGVENPTFIYSYYNPYGCFSLVEIMQRNEWDCYISDSLSNDYMSMLSNKINQPLYLGVENIYTTRGFLKCLAKSIRTQIAEQGKFFSIELK